MLHVYHDDEADLKEIEHERIAVIGYGSQGAFHVSPHFRALEIALEELVAAGYPPEVAVMELHGSGELGQILTRAAEVGLYRMLESDGSPACRYGVLTHRETVIDAQHLARGARRVIDRIRDGSFASELIEDQRAGHPRLAKLTAASHSLKLGDAERRVRKLLGKDE